MEDDDALRDGLVSIIEARLDFCVVGAKSTLADALAALVTAPDLILLDLGLPDGSGIEVVRSVRARPELAHVRILVLSLFSDESRVIEALSEGADGYLLKDCEPDQLCDSIRATLTGGTPISPAVARHLLHRLRAESEVPAAVGSTASLPAMTPREIDLLKLLAKGLTYADAAHALGISSHTVHDHVKNIYRKLGVNSRGEAVFEAISLGVIQL